MTAFSYHTAAEPEILFLSSKRFGNDLMDSGEARLGIEAFILCM